MLTRYVLTEVNSLTEVCFYVPFHFLDILESLEHDFVKVLKIQTDNQMSI